MQLAWIAPDGTHAPTQTLALPTLPFDRFLYYYPSWQETGTFLAVVAYGVLVYSFSFRYLQLFPQERELNSAGRY